MDKGFSQIQAETLPLNRLLTNTVNSKRLSWIVMCVWCLAPLVSEAQLQFTFTYPTPTGGGTNLFQGNSKSARDRRAALESAASNFATAFSSYNATIEIEATGYSSPGSGTLASAGTYFVGPLTGFGVGEVTRTKITSNGATDYTSGADAVLSVNFGRSWEFDYDTQPGTNTFDWYSVLYHEFTHMIGFASGIDTDSNGQNSMDLFGNTTNGNWAAFDQYLTDSSTTASVFTNFDLNSGTYESLLSGPSSGLYFNGPNAATYYGGAVPIYSPQTFQQGSSGSHLAFIAGNHLMFPSVSSGAFGTRSFSELERQMLMDIGYTNVTNIIPEPSHVVLGLGGIALLAVLARRRFLNTRGN